MLPSLFPRESDWEDQEHALGQHTGLISEAVAVHCALGEYEQAVRVAEQGRGILLNAQFELRADLTGLRRRHPDVAAEFDEIRQWLDQSPDTDDQVGHRRQL